MGIGVFRDDSEIEEGGEVRRDGVSGGSEIQAVDAERRNGKHRSVGMVHNVKSSSSNCGEEDEH